jgi:hypothetical protein
MIVWVFPILAACGIFLAYVLKIYLSNTNLNHAKLYGSVIFNGLFVVPYIDIIENNNFPFLGYRPETILEHPSIGWIAFFCILAHSTALPVKRKVKWWFFQKK